MDDVGDAMMSEVSIGDKTVINSKGVIEAGTYVNAWMCSRMPSHVADRFMASNEKSVDEDGKVFPTFEIVEHKESTDDL